MLQSVNQTSELHLMFSNWRIQTYIITIPNVVSTRNSLCFFCSGHGVQHLESCRLISVCISDIQDTEYL